LPQTALDLGGSRVLVGTCSWTDATLVKETNWYPKKTMTAAERIAYYASKFPIVEVDSTYYYPPTPELSQTWVDRTPPEFTMNIKAWSLLTGHPTFPNSLWEDMQPAIPPEHRDKRRIYPHYLPAGALDEAFDRFRHSLLPLHRAGRLGAVLLQYPRWFGPKAENRQVLRDTVARLPDLRLCVEFRHARWLEGGECETTLELLEELGVSFVCVDEPAGFPSSMPPVVAVTSDLAVVRFHGRNTATWEDPEITTAAERFRYRYTPDELSEWVPKIHEMAASARQVHVLMNNCYRDDAAVNAAELAELLAGD
jgi:uncharacterized protein YecE (DUF72 family)